MELLSFLTLFISLGCVYLGIGWITSRSIKTTDDYFLAGRSFGIFQLAIALIATHFGSGMILATSQESFLYGIYGLLYVAGICLGFFVLSAGIAPLLRNTNNTTTVEVFSSVYKSRALHILAACISVISLTGLLTAQIIGSRELLYSLNVYHPALFIGLWVLIVAYTVLGGLKAVVNNDIFQLSFIILVFLGIFAVTLYNQPELFFSTLANAHPTAIIDYGVLKKFIGIISMSFMYTLIEQDIAQHIFAARSSRVAFIGSLCAALFMLGFAFIPFFFGIQARIAGLTQCFNALYNPLLCYLDSFYPPLVVSFAVYGVFAAIISTADALLCAISSHISHDILQQKSLKEAKYITLILGIGAFGIAVVSSGIIEHIVASYEIMIATLFAPLLNGYFIWTRSSKAAWISITVGGIGYIGWILFFTQSIIPAGLFGAAASSIALFLSAYYCKD